MRQKPLSKDNMRRWPAFRRLTGYPGRWMVLGFIVLGALLLRLHDLSHIMLTEEESEYFNEHLFRNPPEPLIQFAHRVNLPTTDTWGWASVIWVTCRAFGATIGVARATSVLLGTLAVLLIFFLVCRLQPGGPSAIRSFVPAVIAAVLCAIGIHPMEWSQRVSHYGAAPISAVAILLTHMALRDALRGPSSPRKLFKVVAAYTTIGCVAFCIHPGLGLLQVVSIGFLLAGVRRFSERTREERWNLVRMATLAALVFFGAVLVNSKDYRKGQHYYLRTYYHAVRAPQKLVEDAYDLATYDLNLFCSMPLYQPQKPNPALLALVVLTAIGWAGALAGRFGEKTRHFALLGGAAVALPAVLSNSPLRLFPFGGLRQLLYLEPFFLIFAALGFYALRTNRATQTVGVLTALVYLALWAVNLPHFYHDREASYSTQDLVTVWRESGQLPIYAWEAHHVAIYTVREYPEIVVYPAPMGGFPYGYHPTKISTPYLLFLTLGSLEDPIPLYKGFLAHLSQIGQRATKVLERPSRVPAAIHMDCRCLYFPPTGVWVYRIDTVPDPASRPTADHGLNGVNSVRAGGKAADRPVDSRTIPSNRAAPSALTTIVRRSAEDACSPYQQSTGTLLGGEPLVLHQCGLN